MSVDGNVMLRKQLNKNNEFKAYSNVNYSTFDLQGKENASANDEMAVSITNRYYYANATLNSILNKQWSLRNGISVTSNDEENIINDDQIMQHERNFHFKSVAANDVSDRWSVQIGAEQYIQTYDETSTFGPEVIELDYTDPLSAAFVETDVLVSNALAFRAGLRTEYNHRQEKIYIAPRLSLACKTGENSQVSLAYGRFNQAVSREYKRYRRDLHDEEAVHYIMNYQYDLSGRTFRVEAYHKVYNNLVKYSDVADIESYTNQGDGLLRRLGR